jgi:hypothetical protein
MIRPMRDGLNTSYSKKEDVVYAMKNENMLPKDWRSDFRKHQVHAPQPPHVVNRTFDLGSHVKPTTNLHALNPPMKNSIDVKPGGIRAGGPLVNRLKRINEFQVARHRKK